MPVRLKQFNLPLEFTTAAVMLLLALLLGGAAQPAVAGNVALYSIAIVAVIALAPRYLSLQFSDTIKLALAFTALLLAVPLLQLLPLPQSVWSLLPGRREYLDLRDILPEIEYSRAISASPSATWQAFFSMFVPIAVFMATQMTNYAERARLAMLLMTMAFLSMILGLMQLAGGPQSPLRFYSITNSDSAVGFFANRNHFGALLYCALPFAFSWLMHGSERRGHDGRRRDATYLKIWAPLLSISIVIILILGVAISASRASIGLVFLTTVILLLFLVIRRKDEIQSKRLLYGLFAIGIAIVIAAYYTLDSLAGRFTARDIYWSRAEFATVTWDAIKAFFPFGSGAGTFEPVYQMFETMSTARDLIVNHAHNDYLEWILEAGVFSIILMIMGFAWLVMMAWRVTFWTKSSVSSRNLDIIRAASLVPFLLLLHSAVDYPLRTSALSAIFAFCCALTLPPLGARPEPVEQDSKAGSDRPPPRSGRGDYAVRRERRF